MAPAAPSRRVISQDETGLTLARLLLSFRRKRPKALQGDETDMSEEMPVIYEVREGIAHVILNRPHRRNAVDIAMANRLTEIWDEIDADGAVRVVYLDAAECGTFCAGMDLKDLPAFQAAGDDILNHIGDPFMGRVRDVTKPIVCAMAGNSAGAGILLSMSADIRVGLAGAWVSAPEARFGRCTAWAASLLGTLPQPLLSEMIMTGDRFPVEQFERHGFFNYLCETPDAVREKAMSIARRIAASGPLSVIAAKAGMRAVRDMGADAGLKRAVELDRTLYTSEDAREGIRALMEKRTPDFQGR